MKYKYNRLLIVALHITVWLMLFGMPYLLTYGQVPMLSQIIEHSWIPLTAYALIFYMNYTVLIDRFLFNRKFVRYALWNLLMVSALVYFMMEMRSWFFDRDEEIKPRLLPPRQFFIYLEFLWTIVPLFFAVALRIMDRWVRIEVSRKEAATEQLQSELQHLKYQLQPHFFFNSLNNIYSMVDVSPEKAKETIHALGKLMRYLLYDTNTEKVSLSKEIDFMRKYIELMEVRTSGRTHIYVQFPEIKEEVRVAPLLFISLVENAFKHGVSATRESAIFFDLQVDKNRLRFLTRNPNIPKGEFDKSGSGIGLKNLEKRLELLYPNAYRFCIRMENDQYITELEIHLDEEQYHAK